MSKVGWAAYLKIPLIALSASVLLVGFQNCGKFTAVGPSGLDQGSASNSSTAPQQVGTQQILENSCSSCHEYASLTDQQLVASGLIVPGDPLNSPIYYRLINSAGTRGSKNMPRVGTALSAAEIAILEDWIRSIR